MFFSSFSLAKSTDSPDLMQDKPDPIEWNDWINNLKNSFEEQKNFKAKTLKYFDDLKINTKVSNDYFANFS